MRAWISVMRVKDMAVMAFWVLAWSGRAVKSYSRGGGEREGSREDRSVDAGDEVVEEEDVEVAEADVDGAEEVDADGVSSSS